MIEDPVENVDRVGDRRRFERPSAHPAQRIRQLLLVVRAPLFRILFQADLHSDAGYRELRPVGKDADQNGLVVIRNVEQFLPRLVALKGGCRQRLARLADIRPLGHPFLGVDPDLAGPVREAPQPSFEIRTTRVERRLTVVLEDGHVAGDGEMIQRAVGTDGGLLVPQLGDHERTARLLREIAGVIRGLGIEA